MFKGKVIFNSNTLLRDWCFWKILFTFYFLYPVFLFAFFSLRVNLDMGKGVYSWLITRDKAIKGTVVRTTTIPEELGRISYLLTDKTGTLTQNEMVAALLFVLIVSIVDRLTGNNNSTCHLTMILVAGQVEFLKPVQYVSCFTQ